MNERPRTFLLLSAIVLGVTWALSAAALHVPQICGNAPLLRCGSSAYNFVDPWATWSLLAGMLLAPLAYRGRPGAGWLTLAYAVAVGIVNRAFRQPMLFVSDVINATREALETLARGANPYLHDFLTTVPPHSPFPYLPGELLYYALPWLTTGSIDNADRMTGFLTLFALAAYAPLIGVAKAALAVAVFATFELAVATSVDGTNDGGAALLMVVAAGALAYVPYFDRRGRRRSATAAAVVAAVFFAWAILFKGTTWPFVPYVAAYVWLHERARAKLILGVAAAIVVAAVVPFLFPNPAGLIGNVFAGFVFHPVFYGLDLWTALANWGVPLDPFGVWEVWLGRAAVALAFAVTIVRPPASLAAALGGGLAVVGTGLFFAHFSTSSYWTYAATVAIAAVALSPFAGRETGAPADKLAR